VRDTRGVAGSRASLVKLKAHPVDRLLQGEILLLLHLEAGLCLSCGGEVAFEPLDSYFERFDLSVELVSVNQYAVLIGSREAD